MGRVEQAIEAGQCVVAVSGALLRDPTIVLALTQRAALAPIALAGPVTAPLVAATESALARATDRPDGVVVLVEPDGADARAVSDLAKWLGKANKRPTLVIVARQIDLFAFKRTFGAIPVEHLKARGRDFIEGLPIPPAPEAGEERARPAAPRSDGGAPRFAFVGRDDEMAALAEVLAVPGPVVVAGLAGIGKTWLVEHALAASGLRRLPDFSIGWGAGADALAARIAEMGREAGHTAMAELLAGPHTATLVADAAVAALSVDGLANTAFVVHDLQHALGREADFFRRSRLEILVERLLTASTAVRIIFLSTVQPRFFREGADAALRRIDLAGLKGRFLHEVFSAYKAPEFAREKFGPISESIAGHPMAARMLAIAVRDRPDGLALLDDPKFVKVDGNTTVLEKRLGKAVERLDPALRGLLAGFAHLRISIHGDLLTALQIKRQPRLDLMTAGLLDMVGTEADRRYRVHPLVRKQLPWREVADFENYGQLAQVLADLAAKATGSARLALAQEANRCALASRSERPIVPLDLPDADQLLENAMAALRGQRPDLAEPRVEEVLRANPSNSDAWILRLALMDLKRAKADDLDAACHAALASAPTPELVHQGVGLWMGRKDRRRAIAWLEAGVAAMPEVARLSTRLGALLMREGRRNEALAALARAMELEPMLPDAYGLLGQLFREEGDGAQAETYLREAVRLAPGDATQTTRLADLLMARARVEDGDPRALRQEARELLEGVLRDDRAPEATLLLATLLREEGGDVERRKWLLDLARKATDARHDRAGRLSVEMALLDFAQGDADGAERALNELCRKDATNHRAFAALGHVLESREMWVPAHGEYLQARDRSAQGSPEFKFYQAQVDRIKAVLLAAASGLLDAGADDDSAPSLPAIESAAPKVKRRGKKATAEASAAEAEVPVATDAPATGESA